MMLAAVRICRVSVPLTKTPILQSCITTKSSTIRTPLWRTFANEGREPYSRAARRRTLKETVMAPAGETGKFRQIYL